MALLNIVRTAAGSGTAAPKQISVVGLGSNLTMYTVPAGRIFVGFAISLTGQMGLCVNGIAMQMAWASAWNTPIPLTLIAGAVVTSQPSYYQWMLIGVES